MHYAISIISTAGLPFATINIAPEPSEIDLVMRFFTFSLPLGEMCAGSFELEAGLISALYEFSRCVDQPIDTLKFRHLTKINKELIGDHIIYKNKYITIEYPVNSDLLITARTENFLYKNAVEAKIIMAFSKVLRKYVPVGPERELSPEDETVIVEILKNKVQVDNIRGKLEVVRDKVENLLTEYGSYGLESILICGFDLQPIFLGIEDVPLSMSILRDIETFPFVESMEWKYRTSFVANVEYWVYIVNSGSSINVEGVNMNYYYLLITKEGSLMGETPFKILSELNEIISLD